MGAFEFPKKITRLIDALAKLPGVGHRTATRYALGILENWDEEKTQELYQSLAEANSITHCSECGAYCDAEAFSGLCRICASPSRKAARVICVVENFVDLMAIERSEQFQGVYHITQGVLNPIMGIGPDQIHLKKLIERIMTKEFDHLILAINPSIEGDATCSYIREKAKDHIAIERIGFGVPVGGSLEFLDPLTISTALENRKTFS